MANAELVKSFQAAVDAEARRLVAGELRQLRAAVNEVFERLTGPRKSGRGRPKGSKNKPSDAPAVAPAPAGTDAPKRRGRPPKLVVPTEPVSAAPVAATV